jgi:hypothetical protein
MIGLSDLSTIRSNREHSVYDRSVWFYSNTIIIVSTKYMRGSSDFSAVTF